MTAATSPDTPRLRIYPLGKNELGSFDVAFTGPINIGRDPNLCDICIRNDAQVSREHCRITPAGTRILVEDTGSHNGTLINGVPLNSPLHVESDVILGVGRTELRLVPMPRRP